MPYIYAAFGILQAVLVFIVYFLQKIYLYDKIIRVALAFILGGALGNFFGRILRGEVVDMVELTFINYPIFNVTDLFIVCGSILLYLGGMTEEDY